MPEYVYALFDFAPENPDEIYFKAGDRIEVIEKDDVYSDGWWQVSPPRSVMPFRSFNARVLSCLGFAPCGHECTGKGRVVNIWGVFCVLFHRYPPPSAGLRACGTTSLTRLFNPPIISFSGLCLSWYGVFTFFSQ